jgi:hypothetical protein
MILARIIMTIVEKLTNIWHTPSWLGMVCKKQVGERMDCDVPAD